jgi:hypothetical protein
VFYSFFLRVLVWFDYAVGEEIESERARARESGEQERKHRKEGKEKIPGLSP